MVKWPNHFISGKQFHKKSKWQPWTTRRCKSTKERIDSKKNIPTFVLFLLKRIAYCGHEIDVYAYFVYISLLNLKNFVLLAILLVITMLDPRQPPIVVGLISPTYLRADFTHVVPKSAGVSQVVSIFYTFGICARKSCT